MKFQRAQALGTGLEDIIDPILATTNEDTDRAIDSRIGVSAPPATGRAYRPVNQALV